MEEQTMKENPGIPPEEQGEEKTFTQEDLNRILKDRLAKERAKSSKTLEEREAELTRRGMRLTFWGRTLTSSRSSWKRRLHSSRTQTSNYRPI